MRVNYIRNWSIGLMVILTSLVFADADTVKNSTPAKEPGALRLSEQWRVGGDNSEILLGVVSEAVSDDNGNIYILDNQLCRVSVISPEGEHIATLSREGDGPGEVRTPRDVVILDDGSVGIALLFPSKLVRLTPDGTPLPSFIMGGKDGDTTTPYVTIGCETRAGVLLMAGHHSVPSDLGQDRNHFLCTVAKDGTLNPPLRESEEILDFTSMRVEEKDVLPAFHIAHAIGPDGRIYTPRSRDEYIIEVYNPDGDLEQVIEREFNNRDRTSRETNRIKAVFAAASRQVPGELNGIVEPKNPVIASLFVDNNHRLWVQSSHSADNLPDGAFMTYDIFDADGRFDQQISVFCEGDPAYDELKFLPDGRVLLIKGLVLARWSAFDFGTVDWGEEEDEMSSMEIICFTVETSNG